MTITTIADVAGANTTTRLSSVSSPAPRARILIITATGGTARAGDSLTAAARGVLLPASVPVTFEASAADITDSFSLYDFFVYTPSGTTLTITYGL